MFGEVPLDEFWISTAPEYPTISGLAIAQVLPFTTTYLCELGILHSCLCKKRQGGAPLSGAGLALGPLFNTTED